MTRDQFDRYATPHSVIAALLARLDWPFDRVWEPCCGDGRLADALRAKGAEVIQHDIVTGHDFFKWGTGHAPTLITNPPFRVIRPFIDHAFMLGVERMALVCNERLWASGKGHQQWQRHRPSRFVNLTWREDYLERGSSPDRALAISIWDRPHSPDCRYEVWTRVEEAAEC